ncbi:hypothetical protein IB234_08460 [Pseudomonas sp. PDM16]|uniref:hypothetical protein n=1 Tax=Pseudomonas sp. PDM16 TaxID=2769292 RepID=UPI0017852B97|nr:hypothetical protein [Pseudomonas sp. PDM16]MBD9414594.1 hypothetical protein [Pseudomonas sp. PDM16]
MFRQILLCAVIGLGSTGCVAYGDEYARPGYEVRYYEIRPLPRGYDDRDYRWHRDRYQERRHSHYAPDHGGRYRWHGDFHRHDAYRDRSAWRPRHDGRSWQRHDGWRREFDRSRPPLRGRALSD